MVALVPVIVVKRFPKVLVDEMIDILIMVETQTILMSEKYENRPTLTDMGSDLCAV